VYQVNETLAFHGQHASVLNSDARQRRPLDNSRSSAASRDERLRP
jgi:hypothetical protein